MISFNIYPNFQNALYSSTNFETFDTLPPRQREYFLYVRLCSNKLGVVRLTSIIARILYVPSDSEDN